MAICKIQFLHKLIIAYVKGKLKWWKKISVSIQYNALVSPGKQLLKSDLFIIHTK